MAVNFKDVIKLEITGPSGFLTFTDLYGLDTDILILLKSAQLPVNLKHFQKLFQSESALAEPYCLTLKPSSYRRLRQVVILEFLDNFRNVSYSGFY